MFWVRKKIKPREEAKRIVVTAREYGISSYVPLLERFPKIKVVRECGLVKLWEDGVVVASVGMATVFFDRDLTINDAAEMRDATLAEIRRINSRGIEDLMNFSRRTNNILKILDVEGIKNYDSWLKRVSFNSGDWVFSRIAEKADRYPEILVLRKLSDSSMLEAATVLGKDIYIRFGQWFKSS